MGTSNWQNIPWCVCAIMGIEPKRVLDIGVGFGRWGMVVREFAEVWFGRVTRDQWQISVEGIEAFPKILAPYHDAFYDRIHVGDAKDVLFDLEGPWDLVILGDVLEHLVKSDGERILDHAVGNSNYVLINLPLGENWPQEDKYENPYEEHKAVWNLQDFEDRPVVVQQVFLDFDNRVFGSVVLSQDDPRNLRRGLFGSPAQGELGARARAATLPPDGSDRGLLMVVEERLRAIDSIRQSRSWKLLNRLRDNPVVWRASGLLPGKRGRPIVVQSLGRRADGTPAGELCILRIERDDTPVLWDFVSKIGAWELRPEEQGAFGESLVTRASGAVARLFDYEGSVDVTFLAHPSAGLCQLEHGDKRYEIDLQREAVCEAVFRYNHGVLEVRDDHLPAQAAKPPRLRSKPAKRGLPEQDVRMLEQLRGREDSTLAVYVPGWTGIYQSTRTLFQVTCPLPGQLNAASRESFLRLVAEAKCQNLVLSGGAVEHLQLCREIRQRSPKTKIKLLWHGSFLQVREDYAWGGLRLAFNLARQGILHTLGFVKEGMAEAATDMGLPAAFVMNYVPIVADAPSKPASGGPHFGLWLSNEGWRKVPYAMAVAARRIPNSVLHYAGIRRRLAEFCGLIELPTQRHGDRTLSHDDLRKWMRLMHLNLYVTLSECCPMLPLESLSQGTPCLLSPTSHLFRDDEFLFERLVVPFPDSSDSIRQKAERALAERDAIVAAYYGWADGYNRRAQASVAAFLDL